MTKANAIFLRRTDKTRSALTELFYGVISKMPLNRRVDSLESQWHFFDGR